MKFVATLLLAGLRLIPLSAQDTLWLPDIELTADRPDQLVDGTAFATTTLEMAPWTGLQPRLSLQENLPLVPGAYSQNAANQAQDLRLSIRGFGSRSAFGIRGIRLLVDGIPETTPDGQGQVDNLPISLLSHLRLLRGPAAGIYGQAAGGVLAMTTRMQSGSHLLANLTIGSYLNAENPPNEQLSDPRKYNLLYYGGSDRWQYAALLDHSRQSGYRRHAAARATQVNLRLAHRFAGDHRLEIQANYTDSPQAQDPGGLLLDEAERDRQAARDRNLLFDAGEAIRHQKLGLRYRGQLGQRLQASAYAFLADRSFEGRLPFELGGWIDLSRSYYGQGAEISRLAWILGPEELLSLRLGYSWAEQQDQRQRYRNREGRRGDQPLLDQLERYTNIAAFASMRLDLRRWRLQAALRQDWNQIAVQPRDEAEIRRQLPSLNPSLGILYRLSPPSQLFANWRSGFETPSLSELSADPNGLAGFNADLRAQQSSNIEAGWRLQLPAWQVEAVLFRVGLHDELVPYELSAFPGRTFYRNAGRSYRLGLEFLLQYELNERWQLRLVYNYLRARYTDFESGDLTLDGLRLPGLPEHWGSMRLGYRHGPWRSYLQVRAQTHRMADDQNLVQVAGDQIVDWHLGRDIRLGHTTQLKVFAAVENIFDQLYFDNLRINAFGGRYYEPGPGRRFVLGVSLALDHPPQLER